MDFTYEKYAETRPNHNAPVRPEQLLLGREPVFRRLYLPLVPTEKDSRILDLGCGCGEFLYFLRHEGYKNASGVDLSEKQVEIGRSLGVSNIHCGNALAVLSQSRDGFDFISAIDVLEHIRKDQVLEFLSWIHRALRPGGRFICQVPNLAAFLTPLFYMDFTHETPFTGSSLRQVLQLSQFVNVRVLPMGPVVHSTKSAVRFVLWKGITACLRFIQTVEGGPQDPLCSVYTAAILASADKSGDEGCRASTKDQIHDIASASYLLHE